MRDWEEDLIHLEEQGMRRIPRTISGAQDARIVLDGREVLLLCSNNYLGLANHPSVVEAGCQAARQYGAGTGGSRLISGSMEAHARLEEHLADFKKTEAALLFNSGYAANTGILQGLFGPEDLIFSDALNHASIIDGCRLSRARTVIYPHRDTAALEELMAAEIPKRRGRWLIVTDGVFSMDGDLAPLPELVRLKNRFDALLMVDDAHGSGVLGESGRGTGEYFQCLEDIDLHMGTLGKAFGCAGAYLAAKRVVIDTLINRSRSFIFSTSLPPSVPASALAALEIISGREGATLRHHLQKNREVFASRLQGAGLELLGSTTQIVPVLIGDPAPTMKIAGELLSRGIFIQGIRPPTVPPGRCRLRATMMATHQPAALEEAADQLVSLVVARAKS